MSKKKSRRKWQNCGRKNRHHIFAKSRGGTYAPSNIILWDITQHDAYHYLFGNRTLVEVAEWLMYIHEQKQLGIDTNLKIEN